MKRLIVFLSIAVLFTGTVFAQGIAEQRSNENSQTENKPAVTKTRNERQNVRQGERVGGRQSERQGAARQSERQRERVAIEGTLEMKNGTVTIDGKTYRVVVPKSGPAYGNPNFKHRHENARPGRSNYSHGRRGGHNRSSCCCR